MSETSDPERSGGNAAAGVPRAADGRSLRNEEALEKSWFSTGVASEGGTPADAPRIPNKSLCNFDLLFWGPLRNLNSG